MTPSTQADRLQATLLHSLFLCALIGALIGICACDDARPKAQQELSLDAQAPRWGEDAALIVAQLDQRSIRLSWPSALDDQGVETYRVSLDGAEITRVLAQARQVTLADLEPERAYTVALSALDAAQNESEPLTAEVTLSPMVTEPVNTEPASSERTWGADDALSAQVELSEDDPMNASEVARVTLRWPHLSLEGVSYTVSHDGVQVLSGIEVEGGAGEESETGEESVTEVSVTLEEVERGRWHSFEVSALAPADQATLDSLAERVFIDVELTWPPNAQLEVEQPRALDETRLRWPSPRGASQRSSLQYQVTVGDDDATIINHVVNHVTGVAQKLTLAPLPEGETTMITVTPVTSSASEMSDDSLPALTAEVVGLDRSPPYWSTSTSTSPSRLRLSLAPSDFDPAMYSLTLEFPVAQDRVGVSDYRATFGGAPLEVMWSLDHPESPENPESPDEPQSISGVVTLTLEEVTQGYGAWVSVTALDEAGLESAPLSAQLTPPSPTLIEWPVWAQLRMTAADAESITLSWPPALVNRAESAETALRYQVMLNSAEVALIDELSELSESSESSASIWRVTLSELDPEREYQAEVIALDSNGVRSPSLSARVSTPPYAQPRWSVEAEVTVEALDHERAVISWPEVEARAYTQRYAVLSRGETLAEVSATDVIDGRFVAELEGLTPLTEYTLEIDAEGPSGDHALSPLVITFETLARPTMRWPDGVTLTATPLSDTELELQWPAWSGDETLEMYILYRDLAPYAEVTPESAGDPPRFVITDLRPRSASRWRIQARGAEGGFSHNGPEAQVTQPDTAPPTWPDLTLTVVEVTATTLEVSWSPALDLDAVAEYRVLVDGETRTGLSSESALSARLEELTPGAQHLVSIRAVDFAGNVSLSGPESLIALPSLVPLRTDEEIMQGLEPTCGVCHGGCPQCLDDWFSSVEQFRSGIVNDPHVVTPGDPDASLLVRLLRGTDSGLWGQMPPSYFEDGATFIDRRVRGETTLTVAEVERWIEEMVAP